MSPTRKLHIALQNLGAGHSAIMIKDIAMHLHCDNNMVLNHLKTLKDLRFIEFVPQLQDAIILTETGLHARVSPTEVN